MDVGAEGKRGDWKTRDITFLRKVHLVKSMVSSGHIWMYECESWTMKKAEHCQTDAFEL